MRFDCLLVDLSLPDGSGLDLLPRMRALQPGAAVVVLTGNNDERTDAVGHAAMTKVGTRGEMSRSGRCRWPNCSGMRRASVVNAHA